MKKENLFNLVKRGLVWILLLTMIFQFIPVFDVNAAQTTQELTEGKNIKVGNMTITKLKYSDNYNYYVSIDVDGVIKKEINNVLGSVFVVGSDLYYTIETSKATGGIDGYEIGIHQIYKLNVKTLKSTKIVSGEEYGIVNIKSPYIYYGPIYQGAVDGNLGIHCKNLNTKKTVKMYNYSLCIIVIGDKRVCLFSVTGDIGNLKMYAYKFNGTGKTYIGYSGAVVKTKI